MTDDNLKLNTQWIVMFFPLRKLGHNHDVRRVEVRYRHQL